MVSEGLRRVLERGEGVGAFEGGVSGFAEHPVCGDQMQLSVFEQDGVVRGVRWRASGCPASMALAALCAEVLVDVRVEDVEQVLLDAVDERGGLARHEQHAAKMALRALRAARAC